MCWVVVATSSSDVSTWSCADIADASRLAAVRGDRTVAVVSIIVGFAASVASR